MSSAATMTLPGSVQNDLNTEAIGTTNIENSRHEEIAKLAYALWQERGCPPGSPEADWLQAERQLSN